IIVSLLFVPCLVMASPASNALQELRTDTFANRDISLKDLGITAPIVLANGNAHQDFYLPVPAGVSLSNATIQFAGCYLKSEPEPAEIVLSLDCKPSWPKRVVDGEGSLIKTLMLDSAGRSNVFVRLSIDWQAMTHLRRCSPYDLIANPFTVSNNSL